MLALAALFLAQPAVVESFGGFPLADEAAYVGSERCGACHADRHEQQRTHPMALTARPATPEDPLFAKGTSPPKFVDPVVAVLGSGTHGMTPIAAAPGRTIRELGFSYSELLGGWFPTPGTEGDAGSRGSLKTEEESGQCLGCHATTVAWRDGILDSEGSTFGVQCERCHGPGGAHIAAAIEGGEPARAIVNPGALSADAQVAFCAQCHREPSDLEPLDVLSRVPAIARHAGAGLMMSACFRRSPPESTITCTSCHDPHTNAKPAADAGYRHACLRCHSNPGEEHRYERVSTTSDCIACHMPTESEGFHGVTFRDHWIRIPGSEAPMGSPRERETLDYLEILYRNAWEDAGAGPERRSRLALGLAEVLYGLERKEEALDWARESLRHAPKMHQRLKAAAMLRQGRELDEAAAVLERALELDPDLIRGHFDLGEIARQRGDWAEAVEHYRTALALRPDFGDGHVGLGAALIGLSRFTEALRHYGEAAEHSPDNPLALEGLARLLATHPDASLRRPDEAVRVAERAASLTRYRHPFVLDTLAAAHAAAGDYDGATRIARRAAELAETAGLHELARSIRERLALYEQGVAFVERSRSR